MDYNNNMELIKLYQESNENKYIEELYLNNRNLLLKVCNKFIGQETEDLMQECFFALMYAVKTYKENKENGSSFAYYLVRIATWHLFKYIKQNSTISIPLYMQDLIKQYISLKVEDQKTDEEICYLLEMTPEQLEEVKKALQCKGVKSLDIPIGEEEDTELYEVIEDKNCIGPEEIAIDSIYNEQLKSTLLQCLDSLKPVEKELIILRFYRGLSLQEIDPNRSRQRNSQKIEKALKKLRHDKRLQSYYENTNLLRGTSLASFKYTGTSSVEKIVLKMND